jgi:hypothetical protein
VSDAIHVSVGGRRTKITVRDWPNKDADWRVSTATDDGREIQVLGWSQWKHDQHVGTLTLHVSARKALLIRDRWLADTLVVSDRADALAAMVACAEQIAVRLKASGIGNGCLEWQLDQRDFDYIQRLFRDYEPRKRSLHRGKRYLRKRLTDA